MVKPYAEILVKFVLAKDFEIILIDFYTWGLNHGFVPGPDFLGTTL